MIFGQIYHKILSDVMSFGTVEKNNRTNTLIRMLPEGVSFSLNISDHILPTCGLRRTKPWHSAAEAAWCFLGHDHIRWLQTHLKVWDQFADEKGNLEQAYGARWRHGFADIMEEMPCDQVAIAIERLNADSTDRRIWITSYSPIEDLAKTGQKTVPCPVGFSLAIMGDQLCSTLMIRSSDLYFGLPYDVMRHAFVMSAFAASLGVGLGHMRITLAHPHVYKPQWKNVTEMINNNTVNHPIIKIPVVSIESIAKNPDKYVELVKTICNAIPADRWPDYDPKSEVVK